MNFINKFMSISEASRKLKIPRSNISHILNGRKNNSNYIFKYENNEL